MKFSKSSGYILFIFLALVPVFYSLIVWKQLPQDVPTHFDLNGHANGYTNKHWLWILSVINIAAYLITQNIGRIDPKRINRPNSSISRLGEVVSLFITGINVLIVYAAIHPEKNVISYTNPLIGILFIILGNYMYNLKPNYFAGIKVPWTLASDYNWKKTHQLGGRLWFIGGIVLVIAGLFFPKNIKSFVFNTTIAILVIVPIVYSFLLFRKESKTPGYFDKLD